MAAGHACREIRRTAALPWRAQRSEGGFELVPAQDLRHRAIGYCRVQRLLERFELCRAHRLARKTDAIADRAHFASLAHNGKLLFLDQVPGNILIAHRQAVHTEAPGLDRKSVGWGKRESRRVEPGERG